MSKSRLPLLTPEQEIAKLKHAIAAMIPWVASSGRGAAQEALAQGCALIGVDPWDWTGHRHVLRSRLALIAGGISVSTLGDEELWDAAREALGG